MKARYKFGLLNSLIGLAIAGYWTYHNSTYWIDMILLTFSFFVVGSLCWKVIVNGRVGNEARTTFVAVFTGLLVHPLSFLISFLILDLLYYIPWIDTRKIIIKPASLLEILIGMFPFSLITLILFGWLTVFGATGGAFLVDYWERKKELKKSIS